MASYGSMPHGLLPAAGRDSSFKLSRKTMVAVASSLAAVMALVALVLVRSRGNTSVSDLSVKHAARSGSGWQMRDSLSMLMKS